MLARFDVMMLLAPGEYALSVAVADQAGSEDPNAGTILNRREKLGPLRVNWPGGLLPFYGIAGLATTFSSSDI